MIKDGDSNALRILEADYPMIRNVLDKNHYIKNIPNHIKSAVKAKKAPALKGRHIQIRDQINRILGVVHRYEDRDVSWRKQLFAHLGQQMVAHLCGNHTLCPSSSTPSAAASSSAAPPLVLKEDFVGDTDFKDEKIPLNWHCHAERDEAGNSRSLVPAGQPKSQKWKHKVIECQSTRHWLNTYVTEQAERDEIMW